MNDNSQNTPDWSDAEREVIAQRECSGPTSVWNEYLCKTLLPGWGRYLEVCQYEVLAEFDGGYDDDGNELPLPAEWNGKKVVDQVDGYLIGGELERWNDDGVFEMVSYKPELARAWAEAKGFDVSGCLPKLGFVVETPTPHSHSAELLGEVLHGLDLKIAKLGNFLGDIEGLDNNQRTYMLREVDDLVWMMVASRTLSKKLNTDG